MAKSFADIQIQDDAEAIPTIFDLFGLNKVQPNIVTVNDIKVEEDKVPKSGGNPYTQVGFSFQRDMFKPGTTERMYNGNFKRTEKIWGTIFLRQKMGNYDKLVAYYKSLIGYTNILAEVEGMEDSSRVRDNGRTSYACTVNSLTAISMFHREQELIDALQRAIGENADQQRDPAPLSGDNSDDDEDDRPF